MLEVVKRQRYRQMEKIKGRELRRKKNLQHKDCVSQSENKPAMAVQETIQKDEEGYSEIEIWTGKNPSVR